MSPGALMHWELLLHLVGRLCCSSGADFGAWDAGFQGQSGQPGPHPGVAQAPGSPRMEKVRSTSLS